MANKCLKVLIVDDDSNHRRLLGKFIADMWPCKILEAKDGLEALQIILKDSPELDLVILDLLMPYVGGGEILSIIRNKPELNHLPIIICTVVDDVDRVREIVSQDIDDYVIKPIDRRAVLNKVLEVFKKNGRHEPIDDYKLKYIF